MNQQEAQQAISQVVEALTPIVAKIEKSFPSTQNHYGDYLGILGMAQPSERKKLAAVLVKAGANLEGVRSALELMN